jgi:hypothetical protein
MIHPQDIENTAIGAWHVCCFLREQRGVMKQEAMSASGREAKPLRER